MRGFTLRAEISRSSARGLVLRDDLCDASGWIRRKLSVAEMYMVYLDTVLAALSAPSGPKIPESRSVGKMARYGDIPFFTRSPAGERWDLWQLRG